MKYLVMECHPAYVVVLDEEGRFLKAANLHYEVGQSISDVIALQPEKPIAFRQLSFWKKIASTAACLCLVTVGFWQFFLASYGGVRIQINPDVYMTVNRLDYVIGLEGLNQDGMDLINAYSYRGRKIDQVSDDLADRAIQMGFLKQDGTIYLTVDSKHETWRNQIEERILAELKVHLADTAVTILTEPHNSQPFVSQQEIYTQKASSTASQQDVLQIPVGTFSMPDPTSQEQPFADTRPDIHEEDDADNKDDDHDDDQEDSDNLDDHDNKDDDKEDQNDDRDDDKEDEDDNSDDSDDEDEDADDLDDEDSEEDDD